MTLGYGLRKSPHDTRGVPAVDDRDDHLSTNDRGIPDARRSGLVQKAIAEDVRCELIRRIVLRLESLCVVRDGLLGDIASESDVVVIGLRHKPKKITVPVD